MFQVEKYKDPDMAFSFPSDNIDPANKGKEWCRKWCEAIYADYVRDRSLIPYSRRNDYALLRLYGQGNQPTTKYMDLLCPKEPGEIERKGWMNISWDILSVAPKFRRLFVGMFEKMEHDIICTAVDPMAVEEKMEEKWGIWADKQLEEFFARFDKAMGDIPSGEVEDLPQSLQELEIFMDEGFKLSVERVMEMGLNYAFYLSEWREIKKSIIEDFFDLGIGACQDYVDVETQKVKVKYLDPTQLIVRYSRSRTFDNIDHWGYVEEMTISEIREMAPEFTEEELRNIARTFCGYGANPESYQWEYYSGRGNIDNSGGEMWRYDTFKVCVLFAEWISDDYHTFQVRKTGDGAERTFSENIGFKKGGSDKRRVEKMRKRMVYKARWIVGSQHMFDYGYQHDIPRPGKKEVSLSLNIYKVADKSILASIIPNLDNFQLTWLKLQNAIAMAAPQGLSIETSVLDNITIGGKKMNELEVLTIRRQTGDLLYRATTHHSETLSPMASRPVTPLEGGIGNQLQEFIGMLELNIKHIRDLTGMNEISDASTPNPYQPVQTSKLAVEATINSIQPVYSGYVYLKEKAAKNMCLRYQIVARYGNVEGYYPALGKSNMEIIKITADVSMNEFGIKLQMRPTDDMKMLIRSAAEVSLQKGAAQGGINYSDYLFIARILDGGNLKYAQMVLASREKRNEQKAQMLQQQNMELNAKTAQETEQVKSKLLIETEMAKAQAQIELENVKSRNRIEEQNNQSSNEIRKSIIDKKMEVGDFSSADHMIQTGEYPGVPADTVNAALEEGMRMGQEQAQQQMAQAVQQQQAQQAQQAQQPMGEQVAQGEEEMIA